MTEVFLICGLPASGKSTVRKNRFPHKHLYLSRDKRGGKVIDLLEPVEQGITSGEQVIVVDCTFVTSESRHPFIELVHKHTSKVHAIFVNARPERCQFNACWRMCERYGEVLHPLALKDRAKKDPNMFPPSVFFSMKKALVVPSTNEGFDSVESIDAEEWSIPSKFKNKAIILDYDGTVRDTISDAKWPSAPDDIKILPNVSKVLAQKVAEGYILLGASNQSGVAKNNPPMDMAISCFDKTNKLMGHEVEYMFDHSRAGPVSSWHRKPMPGMGVHFIWKHKLNPSKCIMVGDRTTDKTFATRCGFQFQWAKDFFEWREE